MQSNYCRILQIDSQSFSISQSLNFHHLIVLRKSASTTSFAPSRSWKCWATVSPSFHWEREGSSFSQYQVSFILIPSQKKLWLHHRTRCRRLSFYSQFFWSPPKIMNLWLSRHTLQALKFRQNPFGFILNLIQSTHCQVRNKQYLRV